jgi:exopolyphosphatase/guanosine-5'-triphosphate,3'-diphosphate pyrophosphatase
MRAYGVEHTRAVATSAVREAGNRDTFLDRVRLRTGIDVEIIDGSEENRLTWLAVHEALSDHEALREGSAVLAEVGGGSTDISFVRSDGPVVSGTYALGSIRMQQNLASWHGVHEERLRLLRRHILNVVDDIRREIPLDRATHFVALGGDVRFAAANILGGEEPDGKVRVVPRDAFFAYCDRIALDDVESLVERHQLSQADAETLVPALYAYRELLSETSARELIVPEATLRAGLLLDLALEREGRGLEDYSRQVLASAAALGQKYRYDEPHARNVAALAVRLHDELQSEHGLTSRDRLLLQVAALLHDVGMYVGIRGHHKHSQYILSVSDIFGLSREDLAVVSNVARYHRRSTPQKAHLPYMMLDRETRVRVSKLAAILRVANALDADHVQKVRDLRLGRGEGNWTLEVQGTGDLTLERLATLAMSDLFTEVFGHKLIFREAGGGA